MPKRHGCFFLVSSLHVYVCLINSGLLPGILEEHVIKLMTNEAIFFKFSSSVELELEPFSTIRAYTRVGNLYAEIQFKIIDVQ